MNSNNEMIWVVIADSNACRIYQYGQQTNQLDLIKEINHPENKKREVDSTKEAKINDYSKEITRELEHGRNTNAYKKLIVIAQAHEDGLLLQNMTNSTKELITHNIQKNAIHLSHSELVDFLRENITH